MCIACHLERLLTDARHNFIDQAIELLRYQSAGLSNRCMKTSAVSLFTRLPTPTLLAARGNAAHTSHSQSRSHAYLFCVLSHGFSRKRETARSLLNVSLGFASGNIKGLGETKLTVSLGTSLFACQKFKTIHSNVNYLH